MNPIPIGRVAFAEIPVTGVPPGDTFEINIITVTTAGTSYTEVLAITSQVP